MNIRFLKDSAVSELRKSIPANLDRYRSGEFSFIDLDSSLFFDLPKEVNAIALMGMQVPTGADFFEVANCLALYAYLEELSPYEARDERLWAYLCHTSMLDYARARWPIPSDNDKALSHIESHFFARTNRQIERDNAVSRLWWMAHLCSRVDGITQEKALEVLLVRSDVRANIIEHPTISQSASVFSVIIRNLLKSLDGNMALFERQTFRRIMSELNSIGGFKLLEVMSEKDAQEVFDDVVRNRLGITEV